MKSFDRRHLVAALLLLLLGGAGGAAVRARLLRVPAVEAGVHEAVFKRTLSGRAATLWDRLVAALSSRSASFPFERLVRLLEGYRSNPAAAAFLEEFRREPELQEYWRQYRHAPDVMDAAALSRKLSDSARFIELLNRHGEDPGFLAVAEALARDLERDVPESVPGQGPVRASRSPGPEAASGGSGGVAPSRAPSEPATQSPPPGRVEARVPQRMGDDRSETPGRRPGREAHQVGKLATLRLAGPSQDLTPWASLCYRDNPSISREECASINRYLGEDPLWSACHKAGLLDKCASLCDDKPELGCGEQSRALRSCRSRWPAQVCADACSARPDCHVPEPSQQGGGEGEGGGNGGQNQDNGPRCPGPNCDRCPGGDREGEPLVDSSGCG